MAISPGWPPATAPTKKAPQLLRSVAQRLAQLSIPELLQDATTVLQAGKPWENHGKISDP